MNFFLILRSVRLDLVQSEYDQVFFLRLRDKDPMRAVQRSCAHNNTQNVTIYIIFADIMY